MHSRKDLWNYFFILLITIALRNAGFTLISYAPIIVKCIFIFFFAFVAGSYFYNSKSTSTPDLLIALGISLCTFFLLRDKFLLGILILFLIVTLPPMAKSEGNKAVKVIVISINSLTVFIGILVLAFSFLLGSFGKTVETGKAPSPNGIFCIVYENIDAGALGGSSIATVKCSILDVINWERRIYIGRLAEKPLIHWVSNYTIEVNGREQNLFFGSTFDTR